MSFTFNSHLDDKLIREAFPVLKKIVYLNVGTYGVMPEPALNEFTKMQSEFEINGIASDGTVHRKTEETRERLAKLISAEKEEISFTRNATDGINLVLAGIDWQPGDEVITTDEEHEAMIHPLLYLQKTKGIRVKLIDVSPVAEVIISNIEQVVTKKTRLIAFSLVTCETGTRLPAKEISEWAAKQNLLTLFDGAQASGAIPVDIREIGCDFYASNGHKWLSGPKGTGFFYCKKEQLEKLSPAHVGAGSLEKVDIPSGTAIPQSSALKFEFGTRAWGLTAGLGSSLDWFENLGWKNVYAQIASLTSYLKESILERPYLQLISPLDFSQSSGLTSFIISDHNAGNVSTSLRENHRIYVRVIPHFNAIRISSAHFINPDEINLLMEALDTIHG